MKRKYEECFYLLPMALSCSQGFEAGANGSVAMDVDFVPMRKNNR
jgi:hypothetical protein